MTDPRIHFVWQDRADVRRFQTAVSLHSHTSESREILDFVPRYAAKLPVLCHLVRAQEERYARLHGHRLDYTNSWWTPPLTPREAFDLERRHIERTLGLQALVSLTDHDTIEAPMHLRVLSQLGRIPISVEWTVPFGRTCFHLGVHNLPVRHASRIMRELAEFTTAPVAGRIGEILTMLCENRSTLVVLNHPLWNESGPSAADHLSELLRFTEEHRAWLHAAELNGLRPASENSAVLEFARRFNLPVISGGDRHGCEPNANVNLTNASSFDEFAGEVRADGRSNVLFLDQYREPLRLRLIHGVIDAVRDYPEFPRGRRIWTDRVFFERADGSIHSLSSFWPYGGPPLVRCFVGTVRLLQSRRIQSALRMALAERQEGST